ncbi:tetratricopeptide repeat protein [Kribbella endophytica]
MAKRYFISHAGVDKPLALELKARLDGESWVDLHEIDLGQIVLHEISAGIEAATDFVLLWSKTSAQSRWVQFEATMAFTRWLEDSAIALRIVCLDSTAVPLHFRPFLQARTAASAESIASVLQGNTPAPSPRRRFFNRNAEVDQIEGALYDNNVSVLWICGIPGSGKRSLAREALARITTGSGTVLTVTVDGGTAEPELNLRLSSALRVDPEAEGADLVTTAAHSARQISSFASSGGVLIFEDAEHWLEDDGTYGRVLRQVVEAVHRPGDNVNRLVIFTSRRKPKVDPTYQESVAFFYLNGLKDQHALPLLRSHEASGSDEELLRAARELDGHPLALEVIAPQLPLSAFALNDKRHDIATDLIDPSRVSTRGWRLLEILSLVDGPLSGKDLSAVLELDADSYNDAVSEVTEYSLVRLGASGTLALHPLLRDYFLRSYRKHPDYLELTGVLASLLVERLSELEPSEESYVETLLSTVKVLGLAGRLNEARELRQGLIGTLFQTGKELFQERRWEDALTYLEEALTGDDEVDLPARQLIMKALASLGRLAEARSLGDRLVSANSHSPSVLRDRGRVEQIDRRWTEAIRWYERAIPLRQNNSQLYADIAQVKIRMEDWEGAAAAAKTAIDKGGDTPYALSIYSQALEALGEFEDAQTMMSRAVGREPNNPRYRHRLGRIALQLGNRPLAMQEFQRSVEIDATFVDSWMSLASVQVDLGDNASAQFSLARVEGLPGAPPAVVGNVQAKLALAIDDLNDAQSAIEKALKDRRDPQNLALAVRVLVARGESGALPVGQARAQVRVLAKELMALEELQMILDFSQRFPQYFD